MAKFCASCGKELNEKQEICLGCGVFVKKESNFEFNSQNKSRIIAGLLGIFLGSFGVHNFYLGYRGKAVTQLLITILTCGLGAAITSIWGLIEGILILTGSINIDGKGNPLTN